MVPQQLFAKEPFAIVTDSFGALNPVANKVIAKATQAPIPTTITRLEVADTAI